MCLLNNIVLRGRGFCTSSIAQITGNVPRLLADIVAVNQTTIQMQYTLDIPDRWRVRKNSDHVEIRINGRFDF